MFSFKNIIIAAFLIFVSISGYSQVGGKQSYRFLQVPKSALQMGLGGFNVSLYNESLNLIDNNPALTSDSLNGQLVFNYLSYFADTKSLSFVYQNKIANLGTWSFGVSHMDYGTFQGYDATGADLGEEDAGETVMYLNRAHKVGHFGVGASLKFINSNIAGYNSSAIALDIGGVFVHPNGNFTAGLAFQNIGFNISEYSESSSSNLPFDIKAGVTFKPSHMPFRFSFSGHRLSEGTIVNTTSQDDNLSVFDQVFSHVVIGSELLISKNVNLRAGYNHLIRQELKVEGASGGAGFSFGLMFKVKAFRFGYSRGGYHPAGGAHTFTLTTDTNLFFRKGNRKNL